MITLFEKFVDFQNIYPYTYVGQEDINDDEGFYYTVYRYDIIDPSNTVYRLGLFYYYDRSLSMEWSEKEQFEIKQRKQIKEFDRTKDLKDVNINHLFVLLNTIFYIIKDFIIQFKHLIDVIGIGSYSKSKYKIYKEFISDMDEFKITEDYVDTQEGMPYYRFNFILK